MARVRWRRRPQPGGRDARDERGSQEDEQVAKGIAVGHRSGVYRARRLTADAATPSEPTRDPRYATNERIGALVRTL